MFIQWTDTSNKNEKERTTHNIDKFQQYNVG